MIRKANENDIGRVTYLIDNGEKSVGAIPTDIKNVIVYENSQGSVEGVLCTTKDLKEIVAYGGPMSIKLLRYFHYINYNR